MMQINMLGHRRPFSAAPATHLMPTPEEYTAILLLTGFIAVGVALIARKIAQ